MLTIENIESIKYQRIKIGHQTWQITNILDWPDTYSFYLSDGNESINVKLYRDKMGVMVDNTFDYGITKKDMKTMQSFLKFLQLTLNK